MLLNRQQLQSVTDPAQKFGTTFGKKLPEKVIQFGEGNFLRGFADWMLHRLNESGRFQGRVAVVQPIPQGMIAALNAQDGLYTLLLRGIHRGEAVAQREIVTAISRGINPYTDWAEFLALAENPDLRFVISNTTEAGIAYTPERYHPDRPLASFPGKLTAFLCHRYQHFAGAPDKGMVHLPCELIDRNGDTLRRIVLQLAEEWCLPAGFKNWIGKHCIFCNTLVDRIVTGYPDDEAEALFEELGYEDRLLNTGEFFHLWVIEGPAHLQRELPFTDIGLNVIWTKNLKPYRDRKVRVLNGAHTMTMAVAYLSGIETVRAATEDPLVGGFMHAGIFDEILPELQLPTSEKQSFAHDVLERFQNPHLCHRWLDISLNSISKFKSRCLPTLLDCYERTDTLPRHLVFALAALIAFYRGSRNDAGHFVGRHEAENYRVKDDEAVLDFFDRLWTLYNPHDLKDAVAAVGKILSHTAFWNRDLSEVTGLVQQVADHLAAIVADGMTTALKNLR